MGVSSTHKAVFVQPHSNNPDSWRVIQHPCPDAAAFPKNFLKLKLNFAQASQSHLEAMSKGKVMVSNQQLGYTEQPAFVSPLAVSKGGADMLRCLEGINFGAKAFEPRTIAYFDSLLAQIDHFRYLETNAAASQKQTIIKDHTEWELWTKKQDKPAHLLSIYGGHNLANVPASDAGYAAQVIANLKVLKGETLIPKRGDNDYLPYLIFSIRLASYYDNGLCGKAHPKGLPEDKLFGTASTANQGMTELGKKAIREMLSLQEGNRILPDLAGMSLTARRWYYDMVDSLRILGDKIPIFVSHAGICSAKWDDKIYAANQAGKGKDIVLQNHTSLGREDLHEILESAGFIGIGLDYNTLLRGTRFEVDLASVERGSSAERELVVKALATHILKVIHTLQKRDAWEIIGVSSGFDRALPPLPCYQTAAFMPDLQRDLQAFFANPTDIYDLYSAKQIKELLYGYTAEEATQKILYNNAANFIDRALPRRFKTKIRKYKD